MMGKYTDKLTFDEIVNGGYTKQLEIPVRGGGSIVQTVQFKNLAKMIRCVDGTELSVQASEHHYSIPRQNFGVYTHVEVGFPTSPPPDSWGEYFDGDFEIDDKCDVHGYVPVELVREYIELHGGEQ